MTEQKILSANDLASMLTELEHEDAAMREVDPHGGRWGTLRNLGLYCANGYEPRGRVWMPSEARWEELSLEMHDRQRQEHEVWLCKVLSSSGKQMKRNQESNGNGADGVALTRG